MSNIWLLNLWTNGLDYVIAESEDEAINITARYYGMGLPLTSRELFKVNGQGHGWYQCEASEELTFEISSDQELRLTALDWSMKFGKGYLFSHEDI